jgi:predicted RNA-binding protein with PIN domain
MRRLVDGMNVIGSRPDGWWRDRRGAMERLVRQLEEYARERGEEVAVVLDGKPFELAASIEVGFAPGGRNAADDEIVRRVERDSGWTVVTSDAELAVRVRALGAGVESAGSFRRELDRLA